MLNYLRYSNIQVAFNLNPFQWGFKIDYSGPTSMDPGMYFLHVKCIMVRISFVFDDGSW